MLAVKLHGGQALRGHWRQVLVVGLQKAAFVKTQRARVFDKALGLEHHTVPWLGGKGGSVKYDLVLAANLIDIKNRQLVALGRLAEDLVALLTLADMAGAGVDADNEVWRGVTHARERVGGVICASIIPAVFADQKTHLRLTDTQHLGGVRAGLKVAALVKDVVGRQKLLVVAQTHITVLEHQQAVVQRLARTVMARGGAHHPVQIGLLARGGQEVLQAVFQALQKLGLVQHVAGVVAAQRQLGEHDQIGLVACRLLGRSAHAGNVARDIAHGVIELGQGNAQHGLLRYGISNESRQSRAGIAN